MSDADALIPGLTEARMDALPLDQRIKAEIRAAVEHYERNRPRALQKALGPSEIGHPCQRKLALMIAEANDIAHLPKTNTYRDVMPTFMGSAGHTRMEDVLAEWNRELGWERYLSERRVEVWPGGPVPGTGLAGSSDCYDVELKAVIDWKFLGKSSSDKYRVRGYPLTYRNQVQLYGRGYERLGYDVQTVAIYGFPRSSVLAGANVWTADYDPTVWQKVQDQWASTLALIDVMKVAEHPQRLAAFTTSPESCEFCPWSAAAVGKPGCQAERGDGFLFEEAAA